MLISSIILKKLRLSQKKKRFSSKENVYDDLIQPFTGRKVSKYGVISGPYSPCIRTKYGDLLSDRNNSVFGNFSRIV